MDPTLDAAAHIVQLALTPIFLLAGLGSLLQVFSVRLGRIADHVDRWMLDPAGRERQLARLRLRSRILDGAVLFGALAGGLTCAAALTLFLGALHNSHAARILFDLFGGALVCAILALVTFAVETVLSGQSVREETRG